ncbi:MAG: outer membrane protein assembly factor BamD [Myxococcaceae bacterium]|nr:outer membrane protein assembly factor BamD [Myxococcaceae bacterium]MBH2006369.1 outer membrane protein assembly factor BamD [Myxococcaceae bacterium]
MFVFRLFLPLLLMSCATGKLAQKSDVYLDNAKICYEQAEKALANESYEEAIRGFEEVRSKYPYSQYAALSDLRLADTYFSQEKWLEAADAYDFYLRFHPRHEMNPYAWFQVAQCYYKAVPKNFFLFPKSYLKDQTATQEALDAIRRYLSQYPEGQYAGEAERMQMGIREQLAQRDLAIARHYAKRQKWNAVRARLKNIVESYPDTEASKLAKAERLRYLGEVEPLGGDMVSTEDKNEK